MIEPLKYRILRKLKQLFCFNHDWRVWVNKKIELVENVIKQKKISTIQTLTKFEEIWKINLYEKYGEV